MDKSWMNFPHKPEYVKGIRDFIMLANNHLDKKGRTRCPFMAPGGIARSSSLQSQPVHRQNALTPSSSMGSTRDPQKKSGRKRAANNALRNHIKRVGVKPRIEIPSGKLRPLDEWSAQWMTEIGRIARYYIPLTAHTWKEVTPEVRKTLYQHLLEVFDVDIELPHVKTAMDDSFRERFKDFRHDLHSHYLSIPDGEDKVERPFTGVSQDDWESLCVWFGSNQFKKRSVTNKANRGYLELNHRGGSKPFVRHRHEQINPETNEEPNRVEFWHTMHYSGTKGWVTPRSEDYYVQMVEKISQPPEEGVPPKTVDAVVDEVLGIRSGYVRGLGHGEVARSRRARVGCNHPNIEQVQRRADEAERVIEELRGRLEVQQERLNSYEANQAAQQAEVQAQMQEQRQLMDVIMARFRGDGNPTI